MHQRKQPLVQNILPSQSLPAASSQSASPKSIIVSGEPTEKQILKQEIEILREQVKKLKIDKLNEKIYYKQTLNALPTVENSEFANNQWQQQLSEKTETIQQNQQSQTSRPLINFRIGRIVKNNQNYSEEKRNLHQSKTLEIAKHQKNTQAMILNEPSSRLSADKKNSQIHSEEQNFTNIGSSYRLSFFEGNHAIPSSHSEPKSIQNKFCDAQIEQNNNQSPFIGLDETVHSAQISFPFQQKKLLNVNLQIQSKFSKSVNFKSSDNASCFQNKKKGPIGCILVNPEYEQQQIGNLIREKNINIRKISYKLNKKLNKSKSPIVQKQELMSNCRKQQLMNNFIKEEFRIQAQNHRYQIENYPSNEERLNEQNIDFQTTKIDILAKKNCKSRLISDRKIYAINFEDQPKHKLRGKIIKNFGSSNFEFPEFIPQFEDQFANESNLDKKFSLSQMPYFGEKPHSKSNQDQIIDLVVGICRKLGITSINRQMLQGIVIKKFRNCLIFSIPQTNKKVIWYYEGKFYFGEGEKEGEDGYKSGDGLEFLPQKTFYKGQFFQNKKHGSGLLINQKGDIYQGQWYRGFQQGNGKFFEAQSNQIYEGQFKNGKFEGFGILKISETQIYKGTFSKSLKHGFGAECFENGDKYKGQYERGKFNGQGKYKWANGDIYEGQFIMGLRTGPGKWKSSRQDGDLFVGNYLNDKKQGFGKYCWKDGSVFEGTFQNDLKHGQGILIYKDGKKVQGKWQNNQLIEVMNVQNGEDKKISAFEGQQCNNFKLVQRVKNEIMNPKKLRNI